MLSNEEKIRAAIAEQAGEWFVTNDDGPLDAHETAELAAWLTASPVHIEEFLGVSAIVRDLKEARTDPKYSLEAILSRAAEDTAVQPLWPRMIDTVRAAPLRRWITSAVTMTACFVLCLGVLLRWDVKPIKRTQPFGTAALHFETQHGEQLTRHLVDGSVLHLNTDSAVTIRYTGNERLIMLTSGQADFEVAHEPGRAFRVIAGLAEIIDLGTNFDVRLEHDSTVVTVVEGRVTVGPSALLETLDTNLSQHRSPRFVQLRADQQISVADGKWPATPIAIDGRGTTAWLLRQMVFEHEPLERVAAEYNRYSAKPIEIVTPALRSLPISGVFSTDDTDAFIAFLRSLKRVRVEVTQTQIRVAGT